MESDVTQSALFYKLWAWGETHKKQLIGTFVAIVVVGLGVAFWITHQNQNQMDANDALSKLVVQNGTAPEATPEALLKVASDYAGTAPAGRALLLAGSDLYAQGKYDEARAQFQRYLQENPDPSSPFTGQADFGIAACIDAQGKADEAIGAYRNVANRYQGLAVALQARLAIARLLTAQGKLEEARSELIETAQRYSGPMGDEAKMELQKMFVAHPELIPESRPVPPAPALTMPMNQPATAKLPAKTITNLPTGVSPAGANSH